MSPAPTPTPRTDSIHKECGHLMSVASAYHRMRIHSGSLERELAAAKDVKPIAGNFLPDNPTQGDCLHAIRAIIGRSSLMPSSGDKTIFAQLYNLADKGLYIGPSPDPQAARLAGALELVHEYGQSSAGSDGPRVSWVEIYEAVTRELAAYNAGKEGK